ncbi:lipopolysaccharide biosynthesis protein [Novosphingobium sp. RD2P27]|uniref:Lipopolysaccharide biosynthesis protein n=1 Tax=Novosphingobium kalidii TaxID=3230299 RepID=A0ABV2CZU8_9SPHN
MNVQGIISPAAELEAQPSSWRSRITDWAVRRRYLLLVVFLPTILLASYLYLIAADQYQSEAHFVVSSGGDNTAIPTGGLGQMLGMSAALSGAQGEVLSVTDYLHSHDAVQALRQKTDLVSIFRRPGADFVSRLWVADPTPETLLRYYRDKVSVHYDRDTGITTLKVRSFRPSDSYVIAENLLQLGEAQVNEMNRRSYRDAVAMARAQLAEAEEGVADIQRRITGYREAGRDIDPPGTGEAQTELVTNLRGNLAAAQARLNSMGSAISHTSPQYVALSRHISALRRELASQAGMLAGGGGTIAQNLGGYEDLKVRQEFAAKRYEASAAALEKARMEAQKQQLYLVRVVNPNMPVKSLFPERGKIVLTVFIGLLLVYGIGWLIAAGVREHAA